MKTKILIILIISVGLGAGGVLVYTNFIIPEKLEKPSTEEFPKEEPPLEKEEKKVETPEPETFEEVEKPIEEAEEIKESEGPVEIYNQNISGEIKQNQIWSGTIHVTGDIDVIEGVNLTILPGTVIKVALTDDQHQGRDEPMTDPYNFPKDPPFYEKEKITIRISGTLNAIGTSDKRIVFTSASENPTTYDWRGINIVHGRLEYAIVEYAQGNLQLQHSSDVVISNNIIRNSLTCCICIGHSNQVSPQILNNDVYNCGHEGIDYAGGSAIIKGNYFHLENPEIQPDPFRGGVGIVVYKNTYPTIEDNVFEKLGIAIYFHANSKNPEEQGKKVILKNNRIENNGVVFNIDQDYPFDVVVQENNELINNKG